MIHQSTEAWCQVELWSISRQQRIECLALQGLTLFLWIGYNVLNCSFGIMWESKCPASGSILKFNITKRVSQVLRGLADQLFFQLKIFSNFFTQNWLCSLANDQAITNIQNNTLIVFPTVLLIRLLNPKVGISKWRFKIHVFHAASKMVPKVSSSNLTAS